MDSAGLCTKPTPEPQTRKEKKWQKKISRVKENRGVTESRGARGSDVNGSAGISTIGAWWDRWVK